MANKVSVGLIALDIARDLKYVELKIIEHGDNSISLRFEIGDQFTVLEMPSFVNLPAENVKMAILQELLICFDNLLGEVYEKVVNKK